MPVEVLAIPKKDDIGLWLGVRENGDWILRPENRPTAKAGEQQIIQLCNTGRVMTTDWSHLDDVAADELDPIILVEDVGFDHPVVLVQREPPPLDLDV